MHPIRIRDWELNLPHPVTPGLKWLVVDVVYNLVLDHGLFDFFLDQVPKHVFIFEKFLGRA